jgi:hypothetical protein
MYNLVIIKLVLCTIIFKTRPSRGTLLLLKMFVCTINFSSKKISLSYEAKKKDDKLIKGSDTDGWVMGLDAVIILI